MPVTAAHVHAQVGLVARPSHAAVRWYQSSSLMQQKLHQAHGHELVHDVAVKIMHCPSRHLQGTGPDVIVLLVLPLTQRCQALARLVRRRIENFIKQKPGDHAGQAAASWSRQCHLCC